ncbi:MAG: hypothetical protein ABR974_03320 [Bacteroidales bacterium]|jgi:hypothetical protein
MNQKIKKARVLLSIMIALAVLGAISSCEKYTYTPPVLNIADTVHFEAQIQPIFNGICINCHNGGQSPDLRDGKSYNSLTTGGFVNLPAETSILYTHITTNSQHIPRTTDLQKQQILVWIEQGALNN